MLLLITESYEEWPKVIMGELVVANNRTKVTGPDHLSLNRRGEGRASENH